MLQRSGYRSPVPVCLWTPKCSCSHVQNGFLHVKNLSWLIPFLTIVFLAFLWCDRHLFVCISPDHPQNAFKPHLTFYSFGSRVDLKNSLQTPGRSEVSYLNPFIAWVWLIFIVHFVSFYIFLLLTTRFETVPQTCHM